MDAMVNAVLPAATASTTSKPDWFPNWQGETIAIIASGPTAKKAGVDQLRDKVRVIAINESWQLCPWADVLYACDGQWWRVHDGVKKFHGLKLCPDKEACNLYQLRKTEITHIHSDKIAMEVPGHVGAGGNSGFQCLNLAAQFGGKRILLVGYDMRVDLGEHWHPRYQMPLSNPHPNDNLPRWRRAIDGAHGPLEDLGIQVINCSAVSLLKKYQKMTLAEALQCDL